MLTKKFAREFISKNFYVGLECLLEMQENWCFIVEDLSEYCRPEQINIQNKNNSVLFIKVTMGMMLDIQPHKTYILKKIENYFHRKIVNNIVFIPNYNE